MKNLLMGLFPVDFEEGERPIKALGETATSENGPLRRRNGPLTLMGCFRAPHHGRKRPLSKAH